MTPTYTLTIKGKLCELHCMSAASHGVSHSTQGLGSLSVGRLHLPLEVGGTTYKWKKKCGWPFLLREGLKKVYDILNPDPPTPTHTTNHTPTINIKCQYMRKLNTHAINVTIKLVVYRTSINIKCQYMRESSTHATNVTQNLLWSVQDCLCLHHPKTSFFFLSEAVSCL